MLEPVIAEPTAFVVVNSTTAGTTAVPEPWIWPTEVFEAERPGADGIDSVGWGPSVKIPDVLRTEPAEFVEGIIITAVDAPTTELGVCSEGLLLSVEIGVTGDPTLVTTGTETADLGVDEASGTGTKAVNVLENVKADPAEFVNVTTNTELVVIREGLMPVVEVVSKVSAEGRVDSVSMGTRLFDDSLADEEFEICKVTDVWVVDPEALVVANVKTVLDTAAVVSCSSVLKVW